MTQEYETLLQFLEPFIFGAEGFLGVTKVRRSKNPAKNKLWGQYTNIYPKVSNNKVDIPKDILEANTEWEWYFTPAVLSEESRTQNKFKQSNVIWIDFDEWVDVKNMNPAPSIVLASSQNKYHCYWIMEEPITNANDMRYWCKKFLHHFQQGDKTGFDATQLLRLPWGKNLKLASRDEDGNFFEPHVVSLNPTLRYNESSLSFMQEPVVYPAPMVDTSDYGEAPSSDRSWEEYFDEYDDILPPEMFRKIAKPKGGGEEKRSGELYSVACSLYEIMKEEEKVFQLLYKSPLDKFSQDNGDIRGADLLWKDINRVRVKVNARWATDNSVDYVQNVITGPGTHRDKGVAVSAFVMEELLKTGELLHSSEGDMYYADKKSGAPSLYNVSTDKTSEFAGFVCTNFGINAGVDYTILSGVLHSILYKCQQQPEVELYNFAFYDFFRNVCYVDRYDGTMYVLDGETIEHQPQGYDGIYFHRNQDGQPYEYNSEYRPGGLEALVLDGPNYTTQNKNIAVKQIHHILKTWIATFFFPNKMTTKPIVLIHGEPDSGKTTLFRCLSAMITGDHEILVTDMPTDVKEFNVLVSQNHFICLDNVNVNSKQMQERLAQAATGYVSKNRTLHTNKGVTNLRARAFIGMTSFTLDKIQKDVAQRYIILPVHPFLADRNYKRKSLSSILEEVVESRNALWSELLDYVNNLVEVIGMHGLQATGTQLRMADYAAFLELSADMVGLDYPTMEDFIKRMQSETMQENDPIFSAIKKFFETGPDFDVKYTGKALYDLLCRFDRKLATTYKSSQKFSSSIRIHLAQDTLRFAGIGVEAIKYGKSYKYKIYPLAFEGIDEDDENYDEEL